MVKNILIAGVGGQGTLLASKILARLLLSEGFDVKVSEVHGMSQRGGSVVTHVRFGEKVFSPVIDKGCADIIVAFELLEAARCLEYAKPGAKIVVNTQMIAPQSVIAGSAVYPESLAEKMQAAGADVIAVDCLALAGQAGSAKAVNVVLLGCLSSLFSIPECSWIDAIEAAVPEKFLELNKKAFALGQQSRK